MEENITSEQSLNNRNQTLKNKIKHQRWLIVLLLVIIVLGGVRLIVKMTPNQAPSVNHDNKSSIDQSSNTKTNSNQPKTAKPSPEPAKSDQSKKDFCTKWDGICLKYPKGWNLDYNYSPRDDESVVESIAIGPEGSDKPKLMLYTTNSGLGGACDPELKLRYYALHKIPTGLDTNKWKTPASFQGGVSGPIYVVSEAIQQSEVDGVKYSADISFYQSNWIHQSATPADRNLCQEGVGGAEYYILGNGRVRGRGLMVSAWLSKNIGGRTGYYFNSLDQAKAFLNSDEIKQLMEVAASVYYPNQLAK